MKGLKGIIAGIAPTLATALGGPFAGTATKFIANKLLGKDEATEFELEEVIKNASPDQLGELKKIDADFKIEMGRQNVNLEELAFKDRDSAREHHKDNHMPAIICLMLTAMVSAGGYALFTIDIPDVNRTIANMLYGAVLAKWGDSIAYWVGTTRSSADKSKALIK